MWIVLQVFISALLVINLLLVVLFVAHVVRCFIESFFD